MTKVILPKWVDQQKAKAIAAVDAQERAAQEAFAEEKYKTTNLEELAAEIEPLLVTAYNKVEAWRKKNMDLLGGERMFCNSIRCKLQPLVAASIPLIDVMKRNEFAETQADRDLRSRFSRLRMQVEKAYENVRLNVNSLANAKLGMEYLAGLGFDLTDLKASDEKPVETALSVPINTAFLLLGRAKEE